MKKTDRAYNVKQIFYEDGSSRIQVADNAFIKHDGRPKKRVKEASYIRTEEDIKRSKDNSIKRAKKAIEAYGRCNKWYYFVTLTLNDDKVNGLDYEAANNAFLKWYDAFRKRYPEAYYLSVMEMGHKNGRWHLHALFGGCKLKLIDSGKKTSRHDKIYNLDISEYNLGFTTVTKVRSSQAAGRYISKYVGKALGDVPENAKRYWASKSLISEADVTVKYLLDQDEKGMLIEIMKKYSDSESSCYIPVIDNTIMYFRFNSYFSIEDIFEPAA